MLSRLGVVVGSEARLEAQKTEREGTYTPSVWPSGVGWGYADDGTAHPVRTTPGGQNARGTVEEGTQAWRTRKIVTTMAHQ